MVPLYKKTEIVGLVTYNQNLDEYHKHDYYTGKVGNHTGIYRTRDGEFYICHGFAYEDKEDYAEIIPKNQARQIAIKYHMDRELYEKIFKEPYPKLDTEEGDE